MRREGGREKGEKVKSKMRAVNDTLSVMEEVGECKRYKEGVEIEKCIWSIMRW
jgi:hypothetical protein